MSNITDITDPQVNNELRPYFSMVTEHEQTLATIVLLSDTPPNTAEDESVNNDYLTSFSNYVNVPSPKISEIFASNNTVQTVPELPLLESQGVTQYYGLFNNFSLTGVTEQKEQMTKVHMNFGGSWNAFFFGDKPTVYAFNGFFLDSKEYPYYQEFMMAYDNYLAGRKCVENKFQMLITYDGKIIGGYILGINTSANANNPYMKSFSFTVLVASENWYRTNIVRSSSGGMVEGLNYMSSERARLSSLTYYDLTGSNT